MENTQRLTRLTTKEGNTVPSTGGLRFPAFVPPLGYL